MISLYGAGFVGGHFAKMYHEFVDVQGRDERNPKHKDILYFISTVDNYNVHDKITLDVDTNLHVLCEVLDHCRSEDITFNFISSWFVYGKGDTPASETSPCNPQGFYSITKFCDRIESLWIAVSVFSCWKDSFSVDKPRGKKVKGNVF